MSQKVRLKIKRFNPKTDTKPYYRKYVLGIETWASVLDALKKIHEEVDPELSFRMSCESGICGSCSMKINGRARLACKTKIKDQLKEFGEIIIEPLGNLPVIKDLVVDMTPFYDEIKGIKPWVETAKSPTEEHIVKSDEIEKIEKSSECIWCGACFSDCPSREQEEKYLGPAASVVAHRYIFDKRDTRKTERLKTLTQKNIWMCAHCERANENCPQEIKPMEIISELREENIKNGITANDGARHARTIEKSVKKYGELAESRLPLGTFGFIRVIKFVPFALKLLIKGKFPPLFIKKIKNHKQIKTLYNNVKKNDQK